MMTSSPITKTHVFVALLMLVSMGFASADITVTKYDHHQYMNSAHDETFVCSCATTTDYHTVTNEGDFAAYFDFTLEKEMEWVSMQQSGAYLQPGESVRIAVDVSPPCGLEQDPIYKVYSTSQYGRHAVSQTSVTATVCESLQFALEQHNNNILPCTQADFSLVVKNIAPYADDYVLSADDEAVTIHNPQVRLQPGESIQVPASATWSCDVSGPQNVEFSATAQSNQNTHTKNAIVDIKHDYEYAITPLDTTPQGVCAQEQTTKQLLLTNTAETQNTYNLQHRGASFVELSQQRVVLQPGQSKVIDVVINPTEQNLGVHTSTVRVQNEYGNVDKSIQVQHDVRDCYENIVTVTPAQPTVCAGWTDTNVRVENRGESTETFTLIPEGELYSEVSQTTFSLRPGEHKDVTLNISVPDETAQRSVELTVRQTPGIEKVVDIPVNGVSNAACTQIDVDTQKYTVYRDEAVQPVLIENTGIRASSYDLELVSTVATLQESQVFLAPGEQAVLHVEITNPQNVADGQYTAELFMRGDKADYRQDLHLTITDKGWFAKAYENIAFGNAGTVDWCVLAGVILLVAAIIIGLVAALIQAGSLPAWIMNPSRAYGARVLLAVIAAVFVLAAVVSFALTSVDTGYESEFVGSNYSELYHEFAQDEIYDLDLSAYFTDPDGDQLTYTHSQPNDLRVQIVDDVARLKAIGDFSGETSIVFTAQDTSQATVDSPIMDVRVVAQTPVTFWQWIAAYCTSVNYILLAIIAVLLMAIIRSNPRGELVELQDGTVVPKNAPEVVKTQQTSVATQQRNTQVQGDVVAGDKVTNISMSDRDDVYVASVNGKKFHPADSHFVERMPKEDRVVFRSKDEAIKAGYSPSQQVK